MANTDPACIARWGTIAGLVRDSAARFGDALAIVEDDRKISFNELSALMDQSAAALEATGFKAGDKAILWTPNGWKWIVAALGVHALGGVVVPVNTRYRAADITYILKKVRPHSVMLEQNFLGADFLSMLDEAVGDGEKPKVVRFDEGQGDQSWSGFMALGEGAPTRQVPMDGNAVADIIFTSGTTGSPRGVVTTHQQVLRGFHDYGAQCDLREGDRYAIVNPFSHSFGYRSGWVMAQMFGATSWPLAILDVPSLVDLVEREKITVLPGTPTLYQSMLDWPGLEGRDLSSLRLCWTGAMSIPPQLIHDMRTRLGFRDILTAYALTEATAVATLTKRDDNDETISTTSGSALPDIEVRIANGSTPLPAGESGEIQIRGYNVMPGYLEDPEGTAAAIDAEGWLHTGDTGILDERGYLSINGRLKDMIIVGGFNVYPAEVENLLIQHPAIAEAAVIGVSDARMGEVAKAFVVLREGMEVDEKAVIGWTKDRIANFKAPRSVRFLDTLPRNALGKILKHELPADA